MIYFTADTHFFHKNILVSCNRPFSSVEEMNETMIENYQKIVKPQDTVYFLGDFSWGIPEGIEIWHKLNGQKTFIKGNHDEDFLKQSKLPYYHMWEIKYNKVPITLCHYPMLSWNKSHYNSFLLYGHMHGGQLPIKGKMLDVGVDVNNFNPISIDEIFARMESLPNNWNYLEK